MRSFLLLACLLSLCACVTPLQTHPLTTQAVGYDNAQSAMSSCTPKEGGPNEPKWLSKEDFIVYHLPRTFLTFTASKPEGQTKAPLITVKSTAAADPCHAYAVRRPRNGGAPGKFAIALRPQEKEKFKSGASLLSSVSYEGSAESAALDAKVKQAFESAASKSREIANNAKSDTEAAPGDGSQVDAGLSGVAIPVRQNRDGTDYVPAQTVCWMTSGNVGTDGIRAKFVSAVPFADGNSGCSVRYGGSDYHLVPIKEGSFGWPAKGEAASCPPGKLCYRKRLRVPLVVVETDRGVKPGVGPIKGNFITFAEIFDESQSYPLTIRGQALGSVEVTANFDHGELIAYEDSRPGVLGSALSGPIRLTSEIFDTTTAIVAAILIAD